MCELNKNDLARINGGVIDPVGLGIATLIVAVADVYVNILDYCYNIWKD